MVSTKERPKCNFCGHDFAPGAAWFNANYCRAAYLLPTIEQSPGLSAWELSKITNMPYSQVSSALQKAREWEVVTYDAEDKEMGGQRYRYKAARGWEEMVKGWATEGRV